MIRDNLWFCDQYTWWYRFPHNHLTLLRDCRPHQPIFSTSPDVTRFVDKKCIPPYARGDMEDHFSPSTVDPSPSILLPKQVQGNEGTGTWLNVDRRGGSINLAMKPVWMDWRFMAIKSNKKFVCNTWWCYHRRLGNIHSPCVVGNMVFLMMHIHISIAS